jgi:hypothetical protein
MLQILAILLSLAAAAWAFFDPVFAWIPIGVACATLLFVWTGVRGTEWEYVPELSARANDLLRKFGHYYLMPFTGRDFGSAASTLQFSGAPVGIIGAINDFWWGLALAGLLFVTLGPAAMAFNPSVFLREPDDHLAHAEIIAWMRRRRAE